MNLINPKYSFVQFAPGGSHPPCMSSLPIMKADDLKFQLLVTFQTPGEATAFAGASQNLYAVRPDAIVQFQEDLDNNLILDLMYPFDSTQTSDTSVLLCWRNGVPNVETLPEDTCFKLVAKLDDNTFYISNCFFKTFDLKYTAAIEYSCEENAYGFDYCNGCSNKVRLAFHLNKPQLNDEETVYMRSDGSRKVLSSVTSKEFEGVTDFMPFSLHEKLKIALSHDIVDIESNFYTGGIRKNGGYEIEWKELENEFAPATFKAFATPYDVRNDNCQTCENDFEPCVPVFLGTFTMPPAKVGVPYSLEVPFSGSIPATLSNIVKPAWLNISIGENILFSGIPATTASSAIVNFTLSNECGSVNGSSFVKVNVADCIPVKITGPLPPGKVGELYSTQLTLNGTAPFTLSGVNPTWLSGSISGDKINLTGMPDTEGEVTVSFSVTNCSSSTVNFSRTIDITGSPEKNVSVIVENKSLDITIHRIETNGGHLVSLANGEYPITRNQDRYSEDALASRVDISIEWTQNTQGQSIYISDSNNENINCISTDIGGRFTFNNIDTTGPLPVRIWAEDGLCQ